MDPFGNVPFFVTALKAVPDERKRLVVARELGIALAVMIAFLFVGNEFLNLLGISESALTIAGGVILFLIAIKMVFPQHGPLNQEDLEGEPFIVPLAIPYVAGPSLLASEMLLMNQAPEQWPSWLLAVVAAWACTALIVSFGSKVANRLGPRGLVAIERLMGMVLVAISIQMFLSGADLYFGKG